MGELTELPARRCIEYIVAIIGDGFRLRPALMRSGTLHLWNKSRGVETLIDPVERHAALVEKLLGPLARVARKLGCRRPKVTARFALKIVLAASRQHYLFTDGTTILMTTDDVFQKEMSQMIFMYLSSGK